MNSKNLLNKKFKEANVDSTQSIGESILNKVLEKFNMERNAEKKQLLFLKKLDTGFFRRIKGYKVVKPFRDLNSMIRTAKKIQRISFYFDWTHRLPACFLRIMHLQSLSLTPNYFKITDKSLQDISKCLKKLKYLKNLVLKFENSRNLTDPGIQNLFKCLKRCIFLEKIYLSFRDCPNLTDSGLSRLGKSLKRLTSLQNVAFDFSECGKVTKIGLQDLAVELKGLLDCRIEGTPPRFVSWSQRVDVHIRKSSALESFRISMIIIYNYITYIYSKLPY